MGSLSLFCLLVPSDLLPSVIKFPLCHIGLWQLLGYISHTHLRPARCSPRTRLMQLSALKPEQSLRILNKERFEFSRSDQPFSPQKVVPWVVQDPVTGTSSLL